ncbi:MAG: rhodanese-like domain-containing protein [Actinomycetes bacterium]
MSVQDLAAAIERGDAVVDVRSPEEYAAGHVPSAILVPMQTVPARVEELRARTPLYLVCEVGARSWQVGQFLAQYGIETRNVIGGTAEWRELGWPLEAGGLPQ